MAENDINILNIMGHDVRTSVSSILGLSALAGADIHNSEKVLEYLNSITITARQLLGSVDAAMTAANLDKDKNKEQRINMHMLAHASFEDEKKIIGSQGKRLFCDIDLPDTEEVFGDEARIGHIMRFVIKSCVKYGGDCSIDFNVRREMLGESGIVKYIIECINGFEKNNKQKKNISEWCEDISDEYIKLGIVVVRKMLNAVDGELTYYTEEGVGNIARMTFCLRLCSNEEDKEYFSVSEGFEKFSEDIEILLRGKRILVVEDNEINAEIVENIIEYMGADVEWAINGADAISLVDKNDENYYDMILMDLQMPELDGYATTTAIRKLDKAYAAKLPIVAVTANVMISDIKQAMDAGMNDYIIKPVEVNSMEKIARKYLG